MNNQISNPKTEVPKGTKINDKDYMNSLLGTLKEMVKNYAVALTEASNETLYNEFKNMFDEYGLEMTFEQYVLIGSTVRSYLTWLRECGRVEAGFEDNMLVWKSV